MFENFNIDPIAFTLPFGEDGFPIYWYGIIIVGSILLASIWGNKEIERRNQNADYFFNGLVIAVFSGYFFARITYVALDVIGGSDSYRTMGDWLNIRNGGVNILGGFIGAAFFTWLYLITRKDIKIWDYADVVGPVLLLAQGLGRWANFINQELYGPPTDMAWGIPIAMNNRLGIHRSLNFEQLFHPTFFYESFLLILGFFILTYLNKKNRTVWKRGRLFGLFLIWWGIGRFIIEFFRPDQVSIGTSNITYSMLLSLLLAAVGLYIVSRRSGEREPEVKPNRRPRRRRTTAKK